MSERSLDKDRRSGSQAEQQTVEQPAGPQRSPIEQALFDRKVRKRAAARDGQHATKPPASEVTFSEGSTTLKEPGPSGEMQLVDEQTAKADRVRQVLDRKIRSTENSVDDGLTGALGSILGDLLDEMLPGSALATVGRSIFDYLKDRYLDGIEETIEMPLKVPLLVTGAAQELVENFGQQKEVSFSKDVANKLIAALKQGSRSQLEAIASALDHSRSSDQDAQLAAFDGKVDDQPMITPGEVAAHARLLFEQIILPTLPARDQVNRIHHLAEHAIETGEAAEDLYGNRKGK